MIISIAMVICITIAVSIAIAAPITIAIPIAIAVPITIAASIAIAIPIAIDLSCNYRLCFHCLLYSNCYPHCNFAVSIYQSYPCPT